MIEKILAAILLAFVTTQLSKTIIGYKKDGYWDWSRFFLQNGGMPSTHTSTTVALSMTLLFNTGFTELFAVAALFTIVVMNDAMKIRLEAGEEAKILNKVMEKDKILHKRLTKRIGHTPWEVFIGFLVGVFWAFIVSI